MGRESPRLSRQLSTVVDRLDAVPQVLGVGRYGMKVMVTFEDSFERNPKIAGGQPVLRGTRVPLRTVLASLAEGASFEEVLKNFPTLTAEHLRAAVAFAASSAQEDLPVPSAPPV